MKYCGNVAPFFICNAFWMHRKRLLLWANGLPCGFGNLLIKWDMSEPLCFTLYCSWVSISLLRTCISKSFFSKITFLIRFCLQQGVKQTDHFGFICRDQSESGPSQYMCYVFQCANESLVSCTGWCQWKLHRTPRGEELVFLFMYQVDEVMLTLKQAFSTAAALQSNKTPVQLCEACPMHDLHKLCERIEGEPPRSEQHIPSPLRVPDSYWWSVR